LRYPSFDALSTFRSLRGRCGAEVMALKKDDLVTALGLGADATQISADDFQQVHSHVQHYLAGHQMHVAAGETELAFAQQHTFVGALKFSLLTYGCDVTIATRGLPDFYLLQLTLDGQCEIECQGKTLALPTGTMFVMNPKVAYRKRWSRKATQLLIKLPVPLVNGHGSLRERAKSSTTHALQFAAGIHSIGQEGAALYRLLHYICADLQQDARFAHHPTMQREFESCVVAAVLSTFGQLPTAQSRAGKKLATPFYVNRAQAFMQMHLAEPLTLADLCRAAGISERSLELGFRQCHDASPIGFLKKLRLQHAHDMLSESRVDNVTDAALASGFSHLGRFSQSYLLEYGVKPSDTLKMAWSGAKKHA
jgi:AraC-like DNA-binding protein